MKTVFSFWKRVKCFRPKKKNSATLSVFKRAVKREIYNSPKQLLGLELFIWISFFFHHDIIATFIGSFIRFPIIVN